MQHYRLYIGVIFYISALIFLQVSSVPVRIIVCCVAGLFLLWVSYKKYFGITVLVLICFLIAGGRMMLFERLEHNTSLNHLINATSTITARVITLPHAKGSKSEMTIETKEGAKIALTASTYNRFFYGDELEVVGILKQAAPEYFIKNKIFLKISSRNIKIIDRQQGNIFVTQLYRFRRFFIETLYQIYSSPHGELVTGLTIEGADSISDSLKEEFRRTGLSHIVALSGTNVAIVMQTVVTLLQRTRRGVRFTIVSGFIVAFAIMTGMSSTIMRATIMTLILVLADILRRKYNALRGLVMSAAIMSLINPYTPLYDVSFQLSFIATLSMLVVAPLIEIPFKKIVSSETLRETMVTTLSAQFLVTPMILYYAGTFSVIAPLANMFVVPIIPFAMLFGTIPFVVSFFEPLAVVVSFPGYLLIGYIFKIVHFFSGLSFASYELQISLPVLGVMYLFIFLLLWYTYKKLRITLDM